jgi:DNA mismatch endonuclease (patch repair protein)
MPDAVDPARSAQMARIKSRDTLPELRVRRHLHSAGLRYRLRSSGIPGRPDIVFKKHRIAIFVHGCFWHRHPGCCATRTPKTRTDFWTAKFEANVARDRQAEDSLKKLGWRVYVIWECETQREDYLANLARAVRDASALTTRRPQQGP